MTDRPLTDGRWWWWAGDAQDVDAEGVYSHGECATREEVIARILPEIDEETIFCVVEAQFDQSPLKPGEHEEDFRPFAETRNQAFLIKREGQAVPFDDPLP